MSEQDDLPRVALSPNDRDAIANILRGYLGFLRNAPSPPLQKARQLRELEDLRRRLLSLGLNGENHVFVTVADVQAILGAMRLFVQVIRRIVPQSPERDDTLETVEQLRAYLETSLPMK